MKKLFIILFAATMTVSAFGQKLSSDLQPDTSKYILTIKQGKYEKIGNQVYLFVPTTLTNNTNDTLKYLSMSCSWQEFYFVDNDMLGIDIIPCHWNTTIMLIIAPFKSVETDVKLFLGQVTTDNTIKFKIGFNLIKIIDRNILLKESQELRQKKNIIWSNTIEMFMENNNQH